MFFDFLMDAVSDSIKLVPFLFFIYLIMEFLEHRASNRINALVQNSGRVAPLIGGLFGIVPQCGFSAAAASLYSARFISVGTLIAVFMSTSDEMLPIMLSSAVPMGRVLRIVTLKAVIAILSGYLIDFTYRGLKKNVRGSEINIHSHAEKEGGFKGVLLCAVRHTLEILFFIFIVNFILNATIGIIGEEKISGWLNSLPVLGELMSALIGLIPNCASSVIITELYIKGIIPVGALFAGLLVNAGVGSLVLMRVNRDRVNSVKIIALLYALGVSWGVIIELSGIVL